MKKTFHLFIMAMLLIGSGNVLHAQLKSKEKIATNMDNVDKWLDDFKSQEIDFTKEVNNSIEQIKNDIKTK